MRRESGSGEPPVPTFQNPIVPGFASLGDLRALAVQTTSIRTAMRRESRRGEADHALP